MVESKRVKQVERPVHIRSGFIKNMNSKKPRIYLDTNAINILADKFCGKSKRSISNKYEILFSLPLLDEVINCSSQWRQAELANFMWDVSNRKVLCDIKNLIFLEVDSFLKKEQIDFENYFERDMACMDAWADARNGSITKVLHDQIKDQIHQNKQMTLSKLRAGRNEWLPRFNNDECLPNDWNAAYLHLEECKYFNHVLFDMIHAVNLTDKFNNPEAILNIDYKQLKSSSIGVEFYCALRFIVDSQSREKGGKPDSGDLYDMEHVFYVGLSDYFVTSDYRTYRILHDLIETKGALIITTDEFHSML